MSLKQALFGSGVVFLLGLGYAPEARATLGGDVASVVTNQARLGATRQALKVASGERHELVLPSGIVVRQYLSQSGAVYAVAWSGPRMPDLRELLGPYFAQWEQTDPAQRRGLHHMVMTGTDLVIQSSGHRGSFAGRAWVPSLVPAGVHPEISLEGPEGE
jgi:hypothetical protein